MSKLPKKFPEYLILYKTLTKKIQDLEQTIESVKPEMKINIQKSIDRYVLEKEKIKKIFPEKFFDSLEDND
jgi:hypothetical protein